EYDLKSNDFLLKAAKWLFDKRIITEIKKYTSIDLTNYYRKATATLNDVLNKEWNKGIRGVGKIKDIQLTDVFALPDHLLIRSVCTGNLEIVINEMNLSF
ncbi:MAG TPA: DUF4403 family protein, partial [Chitinophagaceae bacterium]|nr:DUF4403 family protein [Chitinophagaceae bacterium]